MSCWAVKAFMPGFNFVRSARAPETANRLAKQAKAMQRRVRDVIDPPERAILAMGGRQLLSIIRAPLKRESPDEIVRAFRGGGVMEDQRASRGAGSGGACTPGASTGRPPRAVDGLPPIAGSA